MNTTREPQTAELARRLAEAEATIEALLSGQIDAVVDARTQTPVLLAKAQEALRHERDRAQQYLDTAEVILLALDRDGRIALVNRYACAVLGWTPDELQGRDWFETCVPSRLRDAVRSRYHDVLAGDSGVREDPVLTRAGDERLIAFRSVLSRDDSGEVTGTLSSGSDITERHLAEVAALQAAQLSALSAAIGLSLTKSDSLDGALQACADALVTHLGAALARIWTLNAAEGVLELRATAGVSTYPTGSQERIPLGQLTVGRVAQKRAPYLSNNVIGDLGASDQAWAQLEGVVALAGHPLIVNGRVIGVMAIFAAYPLSETVCAGLAAVADHVSLGIERHRSAEQLRSTEERMRTALQHANVGIWDLDYATGVLRGSGIFEAHLGLAPGTFGGTIAALLACIHPLDRDRIRERIASAPRTGAEFSEVYRTLGADGRVRWMNSMGRMLLGAHGEPIRGIGISLDVTQPRQLEEQFQQAQKMEAVGQLAGGVAHDFNNLLTVMLGFCELLDADCEPADPHRADIAEIQKAGARAAELTRQLLAFSRKQVIEPTLLDLNSVLADMRAMLSRLIGEDITMVLKPSPELAFVVVDRSQIEQVIMNLAINARDAMPTGGTLTIETASVEVGEGDAGTLLALNPGPYVRLTVSDVGAGMTPEVRARVFEPFFTTKVPGKGTGLGLASAYGIVTGSGGTITVESDVGAGTLFAIHLPRAAPAGAVVEAPVPVPHPLHHGIETLLLVEDERGLREVTQRMLRRQGYGVLVAVNADEALRLFEQNPSIDLLLTDVVMPGTSGPELAKQLVARKPALHVLYMSGYPDEAIARHGVLRPGIALLPKPFTSEALGRRVREELDR